MVHIYRTLANIEKRILSIARGLEKYLSPLDTTFYYVALPALCYIVRAFRYIKTPQLYAEDGAIWLADGFNKGATSLTIPLNGFFHLPERLFGFVVAILPLQLAPFIFCITALLIFCVMLYYLFSPRTKIVTTAYQRIFLVLCLCLLANVDEFFFNFSNSIFLLGIIGVLIITAKPMKSKIITVLEKTVFLLSCFTLPFSWIYLPVVIHEKYIAKKKLSPIFLYGSLIGALTQLIFYLTSNADRSAVTFISLFSKYTFIEIYNQIIIPSLRFARIDVSPNGTDNYESYVVALTVGLCILLALFVLSLKSTSSQFRYLFFFITAMTVASLKSPIIASTNPYEAIKFMSGASGGDRYFIFGIIGLFVVLAKFFDATIRPRARYFYLFAFIGFGLLSSIHYRSFYVEKNFVDYSRQYSTGIDALRKTEQSTVKIPVNPVGWNMILEK